MINIYMQLKLTKDIILSNIQMENSKRTLSHYTTVLSFMYRCL